MNFQDWWDEYDLKSSDVITRSVAKHLWDDAQKCVIPDELPEATNVKEELPWMG